MPHEVCSRVSKVMTPRARVVAASLARVCSPLVAKNGVNEPPAWKSTSVRKNPPILMHVCVPGM